MYGVYGSMIMHLSSKFHIRENVRGKVTRRLLITANGVFMASARLELNQSARISRLAPSSHKPHKYAISEQDTASGYV